MLRKTAENFEDGMSFITRLCSAFLSVKNVIGLNKVAVFLNSYAAGG